MTTPECEHVMDIESVTDLPQTSDLHDPRRVVHMVCSKCGFTQDTITTKTDEELAAEVAAQKVDIAAAEQAQP